MIPLSIIPINVLSNSNHKQPIYLDVLIDVIQQPTDQHYYLVIYIELHIDYTTKLPYPCSCSNNDSFIR